MRFGAIYIPNGAIVDELFPKAVGTDFEFTPILKPLEPFKDSLVVVKNLTRSHPGSQVGDHAVSVGGYLTGVWPKRTEAEDVLRQHDDRSGRRQADRPGHAAAVARSGDRRFHRLRRRLLAGIQLRLPEHDLVELADHAAADGDQPADGVRAPVRPGGHRRRAARRACSSSAACSIRFPPKPTICGARWARAIADAVSEYLDNIREIERRIQRPRRTTRRRSRASARRSVCPIRSRSTSG